MIYYCVRLLFEFLGGDGKLTLAVKKKITDYSVISAMYNYMKQRKVLL